MPNLLRSILSRFACFQTWSTTAEQFYDESFAHCSPHDPELRSTHRVVPNYSHDWWKDHFDTLGFPLPSLDVTEVMEMTQDHFEQLPMGSMLVPGPPVTSQVEGDPLLNQILAVKAHVEHLGKSLASMLEEKIKIAVAAASTMEQLEGPMDELVEALLDSHQKFMTAVPADWALHTTCIASDFVQQLFDSKVAGNNKSILPPSTIDVPTMLACEQLARVLADAYLNPSRSFLPFSWWYPNPLQFTLTLT
ncbi:uncharacterized protein EDB93DRAFT_1107373 [Suillus bovinus]|uniref:uncharacterized protein n=1 Tax=Suillus bovinus TaxID=48563 RepID=UPI001B882BE7|nr:uncharacterized protein EDB93DRAFT_1107373 [Suillus bovinus]KAG2134168.1 hypothetical protein EDB93DRAFT_1107373 [Suillus bovinus]